MRLLGSRRTLVVHGAGGMDEISLSGDTQVWELQNGQVRSWTLRVADTGLPPCAVADLRGGDSQTNAAIMRRLLNGEGGPIRDAVLLNAAGVILAADAAPNIPQAIQQAAQSIDRGAARQKLAALVELSQAGA